MADCRCIIKTGVFNQFLNPGIVQVTCAPHAWHWQQVLLKAKPTTFKGSFEEKMQVAGKYMKIRHPIPHASLRPSITSGRCLRVVIMCKRTKRKRKRKRKLDRSYGIY